MDKISTYFKLEKRNLILVTITGLIYNVGMTAGPFFEGRLAQCLFDIMGGRKTYKDMLFLALFYIVIIFIVQGSRVGKRFYVRRFANNTSRNMRKVLYHSLVYTKGYELKQEKKGAMMTKAISDVDACVEGMRKFTTEVFDTGIVLIAYAVMLCIYDVRLAVLSCIFIPCAYLLAHLCKKVVVTYNERYKRCSEELNQTTLDLVGNVMTYRVFGRENNRRVAYEKQLKRYERAAVKANVWENAMQPLYHIVTMCGAVLIFYFGSKNVMGTGWSSWDIGAFTTFFSCFVKLALKSSKAAKLFNAVQKAQVSWKRIQPMLEENTKEKGKEESKIEELSMEHTNIHYPGCEDILKDVSFVIKKGEIMGVKGHVASGKTAILETILNDERYEGKISYVGHEAELLSTSIRENITLGDERTSIIPYLKMVCMETEIGEMPDGMETEVGDGGMRLSGGQQARISLARALYQNREILLLDDPFAAVDEKTEREIFRNIKFEGKDKMILFISHRTSLFKEVNKVLSVEGKSTTFCFRQGGESVESSYGKHH